MQRTNLKHGEAEHVSTLIDFFHYLVVRRLAKKPRSLVEYDSVLLIVIR